MGYKLFSYLLSLLSDKNLDRLAGLLSWFVVRLKWKVLTKNIRIFLGENAPAKEIYRLAFGGTKNFILTSLEFIAARKGDLSQRVTFKDQNNLDDAIAKGKGVYILCMHIGSWEAMGAAMTRRIRDTRVVVKKVGGPSMNKFVCDMRKHNGFHIIERRKKGDALLGIKETLSQGNLVGFVIDQARPGEPKLPFFGVPAKTNTSFAAIWRKMKAPIVPGYCFRTAPGKYEVGFLPELELNDTGNSERDIVQHSQLFNHVVEKIIRMKPEQYFWLHDRWKD